MATSQEIRDYIANNGLTGDPAAIKRAADKFGVSDSQLTDSIGWQVSQGFDPITGASTQSYSLPSYFNGSSTATPATTPAGGYTDQQIRDYVSGQGIGGDPMAIYNAAQKYGVSGDRLDGAMGWTPGTAGGWMSQHGLQQLPGTPGASPSTTGATPGQLTRTAGGWNPFIGQSMPRDWPGGGYDGTPSWLTGGRGARTGSQPPWANANPATDWMAGNITQQITDNLQRNLLPGVRDGAMAAGGIGGSRQGIAEGLAIGDASKGLSNALGGLYSGQYNQDRNFGLQNDALDFNIWRGNQDVTRQGQLDQLNLVDKMLGWNQQYGVNNATQTQNTPLNYWQQFTNAGTQLGGMGGTQSQNMQGNPWLSALGGAMTGYNLYNNWNRPNGG